MKEIRDAQRAEGGNEMNTKVKALTVEEMNTVVGGGAVHNAARKKITDKIVKWIASWFE